MLHGRGNPEINKKDGTQPCTKLSDRAQWLTDPDFFFVRKVKIMAQEAKMIN